MKKFILFIILIIAFYTTPAEASRYSFNFGKIRIVDAKMSRKNNHHRHFSGLMENRSSKNLNITLDFYFKDPKLNNGREILVSSKNFSNIPARSTKNFKISLYVGEIEGRDFEVRASKISDSN